MVAVASLVPSLTDLPKNMATGFNEIFGFDKMQADAEKIKAASLEALTKCSMTHSDCPSTTSTVLVTTTAEKAKIRAAQDNSLTQLQKVTNDPYLGVSAFSTAATALNDIANATNAVDDTDSPCYLAATQYCLLYESGVAIVTGMGTVNDQINKFTKSDMVKTWEDASAFFKGMYAFPFILIIAAMCFCGTWLKDGTCCCSASRCGCMMSCCHFLFWFIFFVLVTIIMAVAIAIKMNTDGVEVPAVKGKPKLDVFMAHLEKEYPSFYNKVFKDLIDGLIGVHNASVVMWVFSVIIALYGCCVCCCKPYKDRGSSDETAKVNSEVGVVPEQP